MINPSASGWIDKFFSGLRHRDEPVTALPDYFYRKVRATGFLYGHIIAIDSPNPEDTQHWTHEEISKLALLNVLFQMYGLVGGHNSAEDFVDKAVRFYREMHPHGSGLLKKVLPGHPLSYELEGMIESRVHTNHDIISRNFSNILTNALLFEDVLAFRQFLLDGGIPNNYLKKLEETIASVVTLSLDSKKNKSEYDELLVKLFAASVRYTKFSDISKQNLDTLDFSYFSSELERFYLMDMAVLPLWSDSVLDAEEIALLHKLAVQLGLSERFLQESLESAQAFINQYKNEIPYFNYSNPVKHFYDQAVQTVTLLISRNKNRLVKELAKNGELVLLLTHSTHRSLDQKEKKKVKKQLLEICKAIPAMAIFLLPGGSLFLPLLVKFLPKMLPSAFNENLEEE